MSPTKQLFISHAYADKALADLLRDSLVLGGVPTDWMFYSSARGTGIPSGQEVTTYLQRSLQQSGLVVELLSESFLSRPMCLMELGGAWALGVPTYPIVVPPLGRATAVQQIGNVQMGILGTDDELSQVFDELQDRITEDLEIRIKATEWNQAIRRFKQQFRSLLATPSKSSATTSALTGGRPTVSTDSTAESGVSIRNISFVETPFGVELHGEATSNETSPRTVALKGTFYGPDGRIVGTADALVNQLKPGATKTFTMHSVPTHDRAKVEVDAIF